MRAAVVGHVEWIEFVEVDTVPLPGEIVAASSSWEEVAGGGAVAALQLAQLADETLLFTSLGRDELGRRAEGELRAGGVGVHAAWPADSQRRAICHVDERGERTITVLGDKLRPRGDDGDLPWEELEHVDAAYFVSGDAAALRQARRAPVLVATARELATLKLGGVELDALVGSGEDEGERFQAGDLDSQPQLVVTTSGGLGGWAQPGGPFQAAAPPGPVEDAYGCGDCFAAGLTYALARGLAVTDALGFAARCGAAALTGRGVHAARVDL